MSRKLGKDLHGVLSQLLFGPWYPECGWIWIGRRTTIRHCDALHKRGFASKDEYRVRADGTIEHIYAITKSGRQYLKDNSQ